MYNVCYVYAHVYVYADDGPPPERESIPLELRPEGDQLKARPPTTFIALAEVFLGC